MYNSLTAQKQDTGLQEIGSGTPQRYDKGPASIAACFTPKTAYIGNSDTLSVIYGGPGPSSQLPTNNSYKSGQGSMVMNNLMDRTIRETTNPNRDRIVETFLFEMYGRFDHWKRTEIEPSHLRQDTQKAREHKDDYQAPYAKYQKDDRRAKEKDAREKGLEPEYKAGQRNERISRLYGIETVTELSQQEYNPLETNAQTTTQRSHQLKTLETMLYSSIADQHANNSLSQPINAQNYIAANGNYTISLTEGYIKELDLRYINLTVRNNEEEQNYQLLIRYQKGKVRKLKADEATAKEIEELLKKVSKKDKIDDKDIMETLTATLKRRKLTLELTEEEINLIRKTKEDKDSIRKIWLVNKKENKLRMLDIRKEARIETGNYYQKPTIDSSYPTNDAYTRNIERARNDFTNLVPPKNITKFPLSMMGGVLGFTYIGDSFVGIRDDLNDHEAHEVEIHEAIHTPDEYETRVITKWMLDDNTHYH